MDAIEHLKKLVVETRKEEGCLQYDLIEDKDNKGVFYMIELWESEEHHFQHGGSEHLLDFRQATARLVEESTQVYRGFKVF